MIACESKLRARQKGTHACGSNLLLVSPQRLGIHSSTCSPHWPPIALNALTKLVNNRLAAPFPGRPHSTPTPRSFLASLSLFPLTPSAVTTLFSLVCSSQLLSPSLWLVFRHSDSQQAHLFASSHTVHITRS